MMNTDVILLTLAPALQFCLAGIIVFRKLYRELPWFSAYTLYSLVVFFVRLLTRSNADLYYVVYSLTDVLYGLLALLAIHEAFADALEALYENHPWTRIVPLVFSALLIGIPICWAFYRPYGRSSTFYPTFASGVYSFLFLVRCIELLIFLLYRSLKRRYDFRRYHAGIITGFGAYALISLVAYLLRWNLGMPFEPWYAYMIPGAYVAATIIWLNAFLPAEKPTDKHPPNRELVREAQTTLKEYSDALRKIRRNNSSRQMARDLFDISCTSLYHVSHSWRTWKATTGFQVPALGIG